MRTLVFLPLLLVASSALADAEVRHGTSYVRITAQACKDPKVIERITAAGDNPLDYRAARAEIDGVAYSACWKPLYQREMIYLRYEDDDQGLLPFGELKPVRAV
jgi:hypothetical protein